MTTGRLEKLEITRDLCVLTPFFKAYAGRPWISSGAAVPGLVRKRSFLYNTVLAEGTLLALFWFLHAAYVGMGFVTKCRHRYMYTGMGRPHGTSGILLLLPLRLV